MAFQLNDEAALCSIEILAEAVEMAYVPGIIELRVLRDALRNAVDTKSADAVALAFSTYSRVDRDFRDKISNEALALALIRRRAGVVRA